MAWDLNGECRVCDAKFGPYIDHGGTVYRCRGCNEHHVIEQKPRRFELPVCQNCGQRYLKADLVKERCITVCPCCDNESVAWHSNSHYRISYDETQPGIGEIAQGFIRNTGHIQRIEFINSILLGRIDADEQDFDDGVAVEAEVVGVGRRSIDVVNVTELSGLPNRNIVEQIVPPKSDRAGG